MRKPTAISAFAPFSFIEISTFYVPDNVFCVIIISLFYLLFGPFWHKMFGSSFQVVQEILYLASLNKWPAVYQQELLPHTALVSVCFMKIKSKKRCPWKTSSLFERYIFTPEYCGPNVAWDQGNEWSMHCLYPISLQSVLYFTPSLTFTAISTRVEKVFSFVLNL